MKFVCSQSDLKTNLSLVSRVVPSRPTHPMLGNVLFVADAQKRRVSLTAFDFTVGICTSFNAEVTEGGTLTLPAKLLKEIVSRLPEGEITLLSEEEEFDSEHSLATLTSASGRFLVRGMGAKEFPAIPVVEDGEALMLPVSALSEGLRGALFAASTDEAKQVLTGVHLTLSQDSLEFAATDGHRLAVVQTTLEKSEVTSLKSEKDLSVGSENPTTGEQTDRPFQNSDFRILNSEDFEITIPARALRELERLLTARQSTDLVALHFDEGNIVFELDNQRLSSRKLEGEYPEYQRLIPREFSRQMTIERKRLLNSLELVAVLTDQKNNLVKFSLDSTKGQLSLSVETQDVGSARESMPAEITGEDVEIAFNVKYLMDGLKALPTSEIKMQLNEWNKPAIFTPLGGLKMTCLVMPVQM
ncbi:MAG: DNA polymerase III subunit beta [Xenococcaceae cyanobacterium]